MITKKIEKQDFPKATERSTVKLHRAKQMTEVPDESLRYISSLYGTREARRQSASLPPRCIKSNITEERLGAAATDQSDFAHKFLID